MYTSLYLTSFNVVDCLVDVHATPVVEHVADTTGTEDKPHVILCSLQGGREATVIQLQSPHARENGHFVYSRQVISKNEKTGECCVHHGHMTVVIVMRVCWLKIEIYIN